VGTRDQLLAGRGAGRWNVATGKTFHRRFGGIRHPRPLPYREALDAGDGAAGDFPTAKKKREKSEMGGFAF
jgi:hypothetical protein